jgi:hypothetical protein
VTVRFRSPISAVTGVEPAVLLKVHSAWMSARSMAAILTLKSLTFSSRGYRFGGFAAALLLLSFQRQGIVCHSPQQQDGTR